MERMVLMPTYSEGIFLQEIAERFRSMSREQQVYVTSGYLWPDNLTREQFLDVNSYTAARYPAPDIGIIDEESHTHYWDFCPEAYEIQITEDDLMAFLEGK